MQTIKGYSAREINRARLARGRLWQPSFYDRVIRDGAQLETAIAYIEANPVEAGLAAKAEDYPWSSAHSTANSDLEAWLRG